MSTKIEGTVALVTGANRGIGRAIAERLLERGAAKVYATARDPKALGDLKEKFGSRVVPLKLDVTDANQIEEAARQAGDVTVLVNNAGVAAGQDLGSEAIIDQARQEMEVNYFGPLNLLRKFAPGMGKNGGGAVVNIASVAGLSNFPMFPTYSASKAAIHSLTQGSRALLGSRGIAVHGVYPGPVDTRMAEEVPFDKASPADVANAILDGIESGTEYIYPDPFAAQFGEQFGSSLKDAETQVAAMVAEMAQ